MHGTDLAMERDHGKNQARVIRTLMGVDSRYSMDGEENIGFGTEKI